MELFGGVCCIKGCDNPIAAAGLCNKHWRRNKRFGSPVLVNRTAGFYVGMSPSERFLAQVKKADGNGCWSWTSAKDKDGYGMFRGEWRGVLYKRAHRFSWAYHNNSEIPEGGVVCHSCDNPQCCNPAHLRIGSHLENQREKWAKGRANHRTPAAKLTPEMVREIRASSGYQRDIAAKYGVTQTTVSDIKRRRSWSHIE